MSFQIVLLAGILIVLCVQTFGKGQNMETVLEAVRSVLGEPEFYTRLGTSTNYTWDYGLMLEYLVSGIILCIVVSSVFRFLTKLVG